MGMKADSIKSIALAVGGALLVVGPSFLCGVMWQQTRDQAEKAKTAVASVTRVVGTERKSAAASNQSGAATEAKLVTARANTKALIEKVPVYVPYNATPGDHISAGLARLHDAAASGVPDLPAAAGQSDDAASPFTKTDLAFALAWNYGQYHECAETLTGLQGWAREQHDISEREARQ